MRIFFRTDLTIPTIPAPPPGPKDRRSDGAPPGASPLLTESARLPAEATLRSLSTRADGLTAAEADQRLARYGRNAVDHDRPSPALVQFARAFRNPFILILVFLALIMLLTDVVFADPADGPDPTGVITISIMVLVSASLRFWQEYRSTRAAEELKSLVTTTTAVTRRHEDASMTRELPVELVVPGDIVQLAAGDMVPADVRFLRTTDLQVDQAMLTGEAHPAEKSAAAEEDIAEATVLDARNLGFMGTSIVSGSATAVVLATGASTTFGALAAAIAGARPKTAFDVGIQRVSMTLIRFMLVMVPVVFVVNGITKDWTSAFLFGVTTAVGLTPEMLPLIVTANLAKGAQFLAKRKVIVKRLNSIQNLGAMDVLATDKTGTLTEDRITLERHLDANGRSSETTLGYAVANSHFQTGMRNLMDAAVLAAGGPDEVDRVRREHTLVDEVPFDFRRRRMTVVLSEGDDHVLVMKGAVEEVLATCSTVRTRHGEEPLTVTRLAELDQLVADANERGRRVLAVAVRTVSGENRPDGDVYTTDDERDMSLVGFLTFLDPPKASAAGAVRDLAAHGVAVKVITGDTALVAASVCRQVGIDPGTVALGSETEKLDGAELQMLASSTTIFAKTTPAQKARIVEALRDAGRTVGFLGDGINDAPALRTADVGISVDTAADIAKESADIILLDKDLGVLEGGVIEGRRTFVNTMKYIAMTASSNFGNMFSVLVASALLPFLPMIPLVVLVQNLAYDLSMMTLPWDRVDDQEVRRPRSWQARDLARFMLRIGPISSIFDISTYALMWFVFAANAPEHAALFQSGWFIESIISQTLIVHLLRTRRLPFVQSRASLPVLLATGAVCVFGLVLPFSGWGADLGLVPLPWTYFPWLVATLLAYCLLAQLAKRLYIRRFGTWI